MDENGVPLKYQILTLGDLRTAFRKLAAEHGEDIHVGISLSGKVGRITSVQQWSLYAGPMCAPGSPPKPIKYIHLFADDWIG